MQWVFAKTDAEAVIAETFSDWPYSIRVMEKVGLSRVDTDIGPYLVRYGIAKEGSSVDLTEKGALTLAPFSETSSKALLRYLKWLWTRDTGLAALAMLLLFTFVLRGQPWIAVLGGCAFIGFAASMARSFAAWWPTTRRGTYLQFRQRGLFWVSRSGNGSITPWKTFAYWRIPKRKGIELWNSQSWYWIPPQAFTDSSLGLAQAFLIEHGVKLGNPPGPFFDEE